MTTIPVPSVIEYSIRRQLKLGCIKSALLIADIALHADVKSHGYQCDFGSFKIDPLLYAEILIQSQEYRHAIIYLNDAQDLEDAQRRDSPSRSIDIHPICTFCHSTMYMQSPDQPISTALCPLCHTIDHIHLHPRADQITARLIECYYRLGEHDIVLNLVEDYPLSSLPFPTLQCIARIYRAKGKLKHASVVYSEMFAMNPECVELLESLALTDAPPSSMDFVHQHITTPVIPANPSAKPSLGTGSSSISTLARHPSSSSSSSSAAALSSSGGSVAKPSTPHPQKDSANGSVCTLFTIENPLLPPHDYATPPHSSIPPQCVFFRGTEPVNSNDTNNLSTERTDVEDDEDNHRQGYGNMEATHQQPQQQQQHHARSSVLNEHDRKQSRRKSNKKKSIGNDHHDHHDRDNMDDYPRVAKRQRLSSGTSTLQTQHSLVKSRSADSPEDFDHLNPPSSPSTTKHHHHSDSDSDNNNNDNDDNDDATTPQSLHPNHLLPALENPANLRYFGISRRLLTMIRHSRFYPSNFTCKVLSRPGRRHHSPNITAQRGNSNTIRKGGRANKHTKHKNRLQRKLSTAHHNASILSTYIYEIIYPHLVGIYDHVAAYNYPKALQICQLLQPPGHPLTNSSQLTGIHTYMALQVKDSNYTYRLLSTLVKQQPYASINVDIYCFLLLTLQMNPEEGGVIASRMVIDAPLSKETWICCAIAEVQKQDFHQANIFIDKALAIDPLYPFSWYIKSWVAGFQQSQESIRCLKHARNIFGCARMVAIETAICSHYISTRQLKLAFDYAKEVHQKCPSNPKTLVLLGTVMAKNEKDEVKMKAQTAFENALTMDRELIMAISSLAKLNAQRGRTDLAVHCIQRYIDSIPPSAALHELLGRLYWSMRNQDDALHHFNRALAIRPDYLPARMSLKELNNALLTGLPMDPMGGFNDSTFASPHRYSAGGGGASSSHGHSSHQNQPYNPSTQPHRHYRHGTAASNLSTMDIALDDVI